MKTKILISLIAVGVVSTAIYYINSRYVNATPILLEKPTENIQEEKEYSKTILAFGDSITAGYGLDIEDSYPSQLQDVLNEQEYDYEVINAGLSGDTTAGGLSRIDWSLSEGADIVIVTLGGNDALRGIDPENTRENLDEIFQKVTDSGAELIIGGMLAPENLGSEYTSEFNSIYPELAEKYSAKLIPFFLNGVVLDPDLNLPDGIHPTREGYRIILEENILPVLETVVEK